MFARAHGQWYATYREFFGQNPAEYRRVFLAVSPTGEIEKGFKTLDDAADYCRGMNRARV